MNTLTSLVRSGAFASACLMATAPLAAQWSEGGTVFPVPLKADGSLDVDAPAPKLPNGKPDFSGLWETSGSRGVASPEAAERRDQWMELYGVGFPPQAIRFPQVKGAIPYQPWALELTQARVAKDGAEDPASKCLPAGSLIQYHIPPILEIVQRPDRVVLLFESTMTYRQAFMDGRTLPVVGEAVPTYNGYTVARWEGDTLVLESNGYNGKVWIDDFGTPTTEQLKVTEKWTRPSFGRIEIEMTFEDPGSFTKPYTRHHTLTFDKAPGMMETYCLDENRFIQQMTPASASAADGSDQAQNQ